MKFVILNCIGLLVNPVLTSKSEEEESLEPESNFIWYPKADGSGAVKAYIDMSYVASPRISKLTYEEKWDRIRFFLYTQGREHDPEEIFIDNPSLMNAGFILSDPVKILIHGFIDSHTGGGVTYIKNAYLTYLKVNVIAVDWSTLAVAPWYIQAVQTSRIVATKTASLIRYLLTQGVEVSQIHVLGHSLGAHAAGFVGKALNGILQRITGLDPAAPLFEFNPPSERLQSSDARFVDVIHTTVKRGLSPGLALKEPCGHVDFYPNDGHHQPGCGLDTLGICSHQAGYKYFAESIQDPYGFRSCKCPNWVWYLTFCHCPEVAYLGDECSSSSRGIFYLETNGQPPYARG